jgi:ribosomal-protein-alanine N-acetyltransferase
VLSEHTWGVTEMPIDTPRLTLVPYAADDLLALIAGTEQFELHTGMKAADGLRGFIVSDEVSPIWLAELRASAGADPWRHGFAVVERASNTVIGNASFRGPPDATGMVEIAYGIVASREGRGYATEGARALIHFAGRDERVRRIRAHTLPRANASTRVLLKCGFTLLGAVMDAEDGEVWRWERDRDDGRC